MRVLILILLLLFSGCGLSNQPSVCDDLNTKSLLCEVSASAGMKLEDVGNLMIVANALAIGEGVYTKEQAVAVMKDIRDALEFPVSYVFVRKMVTDYTSKYPGLFEVAAIYITAFNTPAIMYTKDQEILRLWLDKQVYLLDKK